MEILIKNNVKDGIPNPRLALHQKNPHQTTILTIPNQNNIEIFTKNLNRHIFNVIPISITNLTD